MDKYRFFSLRAVCLVRWPLSRSVRVDVAAPERTNGNPLGVAMYHLSTEAFSVVDGDNDQEGMDDRDERGITFRNVKGANRYIKKLLELDDRFVKVKRICDPYDEEKDDACHHFAGCVAQLLGMRADTPEPVVLDQLKNFGIID